MQRTRNNHRAYGPKRQAGRFVDEKLRKEVAKRNQVGEQRHIIDSVK